MSLRSFDCSAAQACLFNLDVCVSIMEAVCASGLYAQRSRLQISVCQRCPDLKVKVQLKQRAAHAPASTPMSK